MLKDIFKKSLEEKSMKVLQVLGKKFLNGFSMPTDIIEWEENLRIVIKGKENLYPIPVDKFILGMEDLFTKYKLKHYPNMALSTIKDIKVYKALRNSLYREMILIALEEVPWIIHKWEYNNKEDYKYLKELINEYVYAGCRREIFFTTKRCDECSDDELILILNIIRGSVLDYTFKQKEWHEKIKNLHTFKIENMPKLKIKRYMCSSLNTKINYIQRKDNINERVYD